jgi:hypothetical protein
MSLEFEAVNPYTAGCASFASILRGGAVGISDGEHAIHVTAWVEKIDQLAQAGRRIAT